MTTADHRIAATAHGQSGSFTRDQAHEAGLSGRQLRGRVRSGFLEQSGVRTYRSPGMESSVRAEVTSLLLDVGEPCWTSGGTAAALHGFDGFRLRAPFHVTVPRGRAVTRAGHHIHTTAELPLIDRGRIDGLPVTSAARTIIDLARSLDALRLTQALDSAVRDGLLSEDLLHRRIVALRSKGRHGIPKLLEVVRGAEVTRGAHSWLEREFLRLVADAGLPRPLTQQVAARSAGRLVRVDCRFPGTPIVVELLGYRFHRSKLELQREAERYNALLLAGLRPFQFTYDDVVAGANQVIETLRRALISCASATTT